METLHLKRDRHLRIQQGHLWAFAGEITEDLKQFQPGDPVVLCESRGQVVGRGYVNPHSLIAVRLLTRGDEPWGDDLFQIRVKNAWDYRQSVLPQSEARRLIYSESDGIPGLIVDQYGDHLVLQSLTAGIERRLDQIVQALLDVVKPTSILSRANSSYRKLEGLDDRDRALYGEPPSEVIFSEEEAVYTAHPKEGHKTGFYLDQRLNRNLLKSLVRGKRVLDLYSYTGAWGIKALRFGAAEAVMMDSSVKAITWGMEDAGRNGVADRCLFVAADVEEFLVEAAKRDDRYDVVILDPPALIKSRSALAQGLNAYRALNRAALKLVLPGGYLVSCSCSHLMTRDLHLTAIGEAAAREGRRVRLAASGGHPPDHPILPGHPETEYLKCWVVKCE